MNEVSQLSKAFLDVILAELLPFQKAISECNQVTQEYHPATSSAISAQSKNEDKHLKILKKSFKESLHL